MSLQCFKTAEYLQKIKCFVINLFVKINLRSVNKHVADRLQTLFALANYNGSWPFCRGIKMTKIDIA